MGDYTSVITENSLDSDLDCFRKKMMHVISMIPLRTYADNECIQKHKQTKEDYFLIVTYRSFISEKQFILI